MYYVIEKAQTKPYNVFELRNTKFFRAICLNIAKKSMQKQENCKF